MVWSKGSSSLPNKVWFLPKILRRAERCHRCGPVWGAVKTGLGFALSLSSAQIWTQILTPFTFLRTFSWFLEVARSAVGCGPGVEQLSFAT